MTSALIDERITKTSVVIPDRPRGDPNLFSDTVALSELTRCAQSPHYFVNNYCHILDAKTRQYILFRLYPAQINMLTAIWKTQYTIVLKTRQFGASTLVGAYYLWLMLFDTNAQLLMLSRGEREAKALLGLRFKPMLRKLPRWMQPESVPSDSKTELELSTGSVVMSLPTSAGDSYTVRAALIDEAALVHRSRTSLSQVLLNVQPTVDAGGQLALVSKADKSRPASTFNSIWRDAINGNSEFFPVFCPWYAVPHRDSTWYQRQMAISLAIDGTLDHLHESYPSTWEEALSAKTLDKRFKGEWIDRCFVRKTAITKKEVETLFEMEPPDIPHLNIYEIPQQGNRYIVTCDPAEGNPNSDPSVAHVYDWDSGEQVATLEVRVDTAVFAYYAHLIARWYHCGIYVERNNHGHSVINELLSMGATVFKGQDSTRTTPKFGRLTTAKSKAIGYVELANLLRDMEITIHDEETARQLKMLEGDTLKAPKGEHDDHSVAAMLYAAAKKFVSLEILLGFV